MYIALIWFPSDHVGPLCRAQTFTALPRLPTSSKGRCLHPDHSNAPAACVLQVIRSSTTPSNTPFTQGLRPLCLPCATTKLARSPLKAEGRPNGCRGRSRVAHRTFRHRHGRHGRREVWACSKQSHKGRRGGRSLTGRSKEAGWRHTHRRGCRMDAQWSAIGRPVKNANIVYQFERYACLPCTTIVPPLADQWRPLSDHCGDHCASIQRPRQHFSHHGNGSAFTLPSLRDPSCHNSSFGRSRKAEGSCCSSYTETELSGFRRPLSVLTIFMVAQRWHEGRSPV